MYFKAVVCVVLYSMVLLGGVESKKPMTEEDCEVCVNMVNKYRQEYANDLSEKTLRKFCSAQKNSKDERFCYFIGALPTSATTIVKVALDPLKNHLPTLKICEKLKNADQQVCELKYEKQIDLSSVNFKKLKVKDLKKILADWGEHNACKGCTEKSDFQRAVKEQMQKHDPEAYKKLKARDEL